MTPVPGRKEIHALMPMIVIIVTNMAWSTRRRPVSLKWRSYHRLSLIHI